MRRARFKHGRSHAAAVQTALKAERAGRAAGSCDASYHARPARHTLGGRSKPLTGLASEHESFAGWIADGRLLLSVHSPADGIHGWYLLRLGAKRTFTHVLPSLDRICCREGQLDWLPYSVRAASCRGNPRSLPPETATAQPRHRARAGDHVRVPPVRAQHRLDGSGDEQRLSGRDVMTAAESNDLSAP